MAATNPLTGRAFSPRYFDLVEQRSHLPIQSVKGQFITALNASQVLLIESAPGTGKSTQIPQWAVESAAGSRVVCARPRRAAATSLAARVAEEMDVLLGEEVGCATREEQRTGSRLLVCTNGWLLEEMKSSPTLADFGVVIVDEVQERTIHIDVLLHLLRELIKTRSDVKIVLVGIDAGSWYRYFDFCTVLRVPTPPSLVEIVYATLPTLSPFDAAVQTVIDLHRTEQCAGAILLFLATKEEVERAAEEISFGVKALSQVVGPLDVIPLHSALSSDQLKRIHDPAPTGNANGAVGRKCVVSTAIGESSIVFDDVAFVVDGGVREFDFYEFAPADIRSMPISKATADLRAQRAGEKVIRLYSEETYETMEKETQPAIRRAKPHQVAKILKESGIEDFSSVGLN